MLPHWAGASAIHSAELTSSDVTVSCAGEGLPGRRVREQERRGRPDDADVAGDGVTGRDGERHDHRRRRDELVPRVADRLAVRLAVGRRAGLLEPLRARQFEPPRPIQKLE